MAVGLGVKVTLEGHDGTTDAFKSAQANARNLAQQLNTIKSGWSGSITAASTAFLALKAAIEPIVNVMGEFIKATLEADKSLNRLFRR